MVLIQPHRLPAPTMALPIFLRQNAPNVSIWPKPMSTACFRHHWSSSNHQRLFLEQKEEPEETEFSCPSFGPRGYIQSSMDIISTERCSIPQVIQPRPRCPCWICIWKFEYSFNLTKKPYQKQGWYSFCWSGSMICGIILKTVFSWISPLHLIRCKLWFIKLDCHRSIVKENINWQMMRAYTLYSHLLRELPSIRSVLRSCSNHFKSSNRSG